MPAGKVVKKSKKSKKHAKCSRRQADDDAGKLQTLDRTIQKHQRAQFYGDFEDQLDFQKADVTTKKTSKSLKGLEVLTQVSPKPSKAGKPQSVRDLHSLDSVLATLSKMEVAPQEQQHSTPPVPDTNEIDI